PFIAKCLAHLLDALHEAIIGDRDAGPDRVHQFVLGHRDARSRGKDSEDMRCLGAQLHHLSGPVRDRTAPEIDRAAVDAELRLSRTIHWNAPTKGPQGPCPNLLENLPTFHELFFGAYRHTSSDFRLSIIPSSLRTGRSCLCFPYSEEMAMASVARSFESCDV